jgi:hypothetical protein
MRESHLSHASISDGVASTELLKFRKRDKLLTSISNVLL